MEQEQVKYGDILDFPISRPNRYTPEDRWRSQQPKLCDKSNKDEDNIANIRRVNNNCGCMCMHVSVRVCVIYLLGHGKQSVSI